MFYNKLKLRIAELEKQSSFKDKEIKLLKTQIQELKSNHWKLENPPKYKKGDKIGKLMVTDRVLFIPSKIQLLSNSKFIRHFIIRKRTGVDKEKECEEFISDNFYNEWEYELVNINTGEKINMKEIELQLKDSKVKLQALKK